MSLFLAAASLTIWLRLYLSTCPSTCLCIFTLHVFILKGMEGEEHCLLPMFVWDTSHRMTGMQNLKTANSNSSLECEPGSHLVKIKHNCLQKNVINKAGVPD